MSDNTPQVTAIPYDLTKYKRTQELVVGDVVKAPPGCWFEAGEPVKITDIEREYEHGYIVTFCDEYDEFYDRAAAGLDDGWEMAQ